MHRPSSGRASPRDPSRSAHLPALAALGGAVDVKAVYSRSRKSSTEFAEAAQEKLGLKHKLDVYNEEDEGRSLDSLLARPDIEAVIVVLPITLQPDIVRKALAAGKHVLSEKPVAPDVASGRALIEEYEAKYKPQGLVWRVAENFETEPGFQAAQRIVHGGKLGTIKYYNARAYSWVDTHSKWYNTPWRTVPDVSARRNAVMSVHSLTYHTCSTLVFLTCPGLMVATVPRWLPGMSFLLTISLDSVPDESVPPGPRSLPYKQLDGGVVSPDTPACTTLGS